MRYKVCDIQGFEGLYYIYPDGQIYSLRDIVMIKPYQCGIYNAYSVRLYDENKKPRVFTIAYLVAMHYISARPSVSHIVTHKDSNRLNNHYTNLMWITQSQMQLQVTRSIKYFDGIKPAYDNMTYHKYRKIACISSVSHVVYDSIQQLCEALNITRILIRKYINTHLRYNDMIIRYVL